MNKLLRSITTMVVGLGLILLFIHLGFVNSTSKLQALNQPSYYTVQNYWYLLVAGCGCIAFSIVSCFLAWNRKLDEKVEVLPNAAGAEGSEILSWLSGSSLDRAGKGSSRRRALRNRQEDRVSPAQDSRTETMPRVGYADPEAETVPLRRADASVPDHRPGDEPADPGKTVPVSSDDATVPRRL